MHRDPYEEEDAGDPRWMAAIVVLSALVFLGFLSVLCLAGFLYSTSTPLPAERPVAIAAGTPPAPSGSEAAAAAGAAARPPAAAPTGTAPPGGPEDAYRRAIAAFNDRDAEPHYAIYEDTVDCFYNWSDYRLDTIRKMRDPQLAKGGFQITITTITPKSSSDDRFDFIEQGVLTWPSGTEVPYTKRVVLHRRGSVWKVIREVDNNAYNCFPDAF